MSDLMIADKTLETVESAIYRDQGQAYRKFLRQVILEVDDAFDSTTHDRFRSHMGISTSGQECARMLWYKWHWSTIGRVSAKMLRLFNRGHLEEARFAAMLLGAGFELWREEAPGKQFRVSYYGGHYGSAIDAVICGIPEMPNVNLLAEMKTHNDKSFKKLAGEKDSEGKYIKEPEGVAVAKPEHYVQMQQYMGYYKLEWALYCAVNKNTDELYFEIIKYVPKVDTGYRERSYRIMFAKEAPPKLSTNASFWKCKYCDEKRVCHYNAVPDFNCRTCAASYPTEDGNWHCATHDGVIIDKERQLQGCPEWAQHSSYQVD